MRNPDSYIVHRRERQNTYKAVWGNISVVITCDKELTRNDALQALGSMAYLRKKYGMERGNMMYGNTDLLPDESQ